MRSLTKDDCRRYNQKHGDDYAYDDESPSRERAT